MNKPKYYLTTPIYFPSGRFHIGTAYTTVLADTIKRYKQERGYDVYLLTGLDEHGQKIEEVAKSRNMTPQDHVDDMADVAKKLWELMDINYDDFIRTTEERHEIKVQEIFDRLMKQDDIYLGEYEGLYCRPCETYFTDSQLVNEKCPDCNREVLPMKEEAYFFKMSKYADKLIKYYEENPGFIEPEYRKTELVNSFLKPGLEDLCVSRASFDWGVKVKENPKHVVYVWIDALTNYITALGYNTENDDLMKKYWPADLQIVGKDIIRFHGIYWPILLMALDLPLPKKIYAHGWVLMKDGKMSKSKGNVIFPEMLIEKYGLDATKYFLLSEFPFGQDTVFTPELFVERFNYDLCNDLGNLLNRTIGMVNKYCAAKIPSYTGVVTNYDESLEKRTNQYIENFEKSMDSLHIANAISEIWNIVGITNKYIDETSPWVLFKEEDTNSLNSVMYHLVENLRKVAILLRPVLKNTSKEIFTQLGIIDESLMSWDSLRNYDNIYTNKLIEVGEPLFVRLDMKEEIEYIKNKMKKHT